MHNKFIEFGLKHNKIFSSFKKNINKSLNKCCSTSNDNNNPHRAEKLTLPEEPTTCCMSGCNNCVWIKYAEELSAYYQMKHNNKGFAKAQQDILQKVSDPSMQAYLMMELRILEKKLNKS